ncbi:hypothetical protein niasHT_006275 [Heterodera trifolii]|uniref:ATPase AAA-type core domain-containing protein n=1 Tax=Heterodera trifolii TaxID=157864 RepID=A0ABD2M3L7_9BILA
MKNVDKNLEKKYSAQSLKQKTPNWMPLREMRLPKPLSSAVPCSLCSIRRFLRAYGHRQRLFCCLALRAMGKQCLRMLSRMNATRHSSAFPLFTFCPNGMPSGKSFVLVLAATNRLQELDEDILGRFPQRIMVDLPDQKTRGQMIRRIFEHDNINLELTEEELEVLRQLRTVLLRTTIADRTFADTIADCTFADDNCGLYFCGPYFCQKINWKGGPRQYDPFCCAVKSQTGEVNK